ncbi:zinc-ribbon domain-containing protein [Tropicibacter oceani]|uniref:Zinc-ribbon domain-containing protein n=1 Tax=Tropicibacter oceani TaxID=3058420 RepID=A0ABY8QPY8_9RHOB|nr:zinc-ribbon domain-containing protein [Tropicibacter oceani]
MRLICPNCGAQYEVPVEVIPEGGRDVQCSNCAHTWFQVHPDDDADLAEELGKPGPAETWAPDEAEEDAPEPSEPEAEPEPAPQRSTKRGLDPQVAEVLREEAARERRQREAEASAFEMQPDLGLREPDEDEQARRSREARARMAHIRGEDLKPEPSPPPAPEQAPPPERSRRSSEAALAGRSAAQATAAAAESRRELLPDVEEINQTLRASSEPRVTDANEGRVSVDDPAPRKSGGFSRGFFLIVVLAAVALAVYASAPQIKEAVPQSAALLDPYVASVDALRVWLDGQVTSLMQSLDGMSSETAPTTGN